MAVATFPRATANERRGRTLCALALLLALLPTLLFMGHSLRPGTMPIDSAAGVIDASATGPAHHEHEQHCHEGLASCSDQPLTSGPGHFLLTDQPGAAAPLALATAARADALAPATSAPPPPEPPPRAR